jgi:hypothetical protein
VLMWLFFTCRIYRDYSVVRCEQARLRWHGSKLVLKYPRCSLKRFSAYADAEVDPSQMWALASVWSLLLTLGLGVAAGPPMCTISKVCQDVVQVQVHSHKAVLMSEAMTVANGLLGVGLGLIIGIPIAVAAGMFLFQTLGRQG